MMRTVWIVSILITVTYGAKDFSTANIKDASRREDFQKRASLVFYYANWCGHCQQFKPIFEKAAASLDKIVDVFVVNADDAKDLVQQEQIKGFPTVRLYLGDKKWTYQGQRSQASQVTDWIFDSLKQHVGGSKSGGKGGGKGPVVLTDADFEKQISKGVWLVEFFAPWCGHCKQLEPVWRELASKVSADSDLSQIRIATLDATQEQATAQRHEIKGFPTIKLFKDGKLVEDYNGGRDLSSLFDFVKQHKPENKVPSEVRQLLTEKDLKECTDKPLCLFAFLPHLLDCDAECRRGYISLLEAQATSGAGDGRGWLLLWSEALVQPKLEDTLALGPGVGYPSLAVVNGRRGKTAVLRGAFSKDGINDFLKGLVYGKLPVQSLDLKNLKIDQEQTKWDGKDFQPEPEERDEL